MREAQAFDYLPVAGKACAFEEVGRTARRERLQLCCHTHLMAGKIFQ